MKEGKRRLKRILSFTKRGEEEQAQGADEGILEATRATSPRAVGRGESPPAPRLAINLSDISETEKGEKEPNTPRISPGRRMAQEIDRVLIVVEGDISSRKKELAYHYAKGEALIDEPHSPRSPRGPYITEEYIKKCESVKCQVDVGDTLGVTGNKWQAKLKYPHVVVLAYDITRVDSFEAMKKQRNKAIKYWPGAPIILVGTHDDQADNRKVALEAAKNFATEIRAPHFEANVATGENVQGVFSEAAYRGMKYKQEMIQEAKDELQSPRQGW